MIVEVHSNARPGRPVLLILAIFAVLCGTLGLAWMQTVAKRSLGPARAIPGTPLIVSPPHGWSESADRPGHFFLAEAGDGGDAEGTFERQVTFRYQRLPDYVSPEAYILTSDSRLRASSGNAELTQIRGIRAVQVRRVRIASFRGHKYQKESVLRVACHPRGDVIVVEYAPMTELTRSDFLLLDAICEAIDFNDPELKLSGIEAQKRIGLSFPIRKNWSVVGPRHPVSPSIHVLTGPAGLDGGMIRVARSWLSDGRGESELLRDAILSARRSRSEKLRLLEWVRRDGTTVIGAQVWEADSIPSDSFVAYALSRSAADVALVVSDLADLSRDSMQCAKIIASTLTFADWPGRIDLVAAGEAGKRHTDEIQERGVMPWWGRISQTDSFFERAGPGEAGCVTQRRAGTGDRNRGYAYSGGLVWADLSAKRYVRERWTLDAKARAFERSLEFGDCIDRLGLQLLRPDRVLWESRKSEKAIIWRRETHGGVETESEYPVSAAYVAPPIEELIAARVARGNEVAVLIEVSSRDALTTHARLLIPLGVDGHEAATVLCLEDYAPTGFTIRFDSENRPMQFVQFGLPLDRLAKGDQEKLITRLEAKLND